MKKIVAIILGLVLSVNIIGYTAEAATTETHVPTQLLEQYSNDTEHEIEYVSEGGEINLDAVREEFEGYNVSDEIVDELIEKLEEGIPLDSMLYTEDKAIKNERIETSTGYNTIYTFSDGSIIVTSTDEFDKLLLLSQSPFTRAVTLDEGSITSSSNYSVTWKNRKLKYSVTGVWSISFRANYTMVNGGIGSTIDWIGNHNITMTIGDFSGNNLRIMRKTSTATANAEARFSLYLHLTKQYGGVQTRSVSLLVGSTATARGNNYY